MDGLVNATLERNRISDDYGTIEDDDTTRLSPGETVTKIRDSEKGAEIQII